jgi:hypothetical protein
MRDLAKAFVVNPAQERARRCLCKVTAASQIAVLLSASCINPWSIPLLPLPPGTLTFLTTAEFVRLY